jgi:transposase
MRTGRPKQPLVLTEEETARLQSMAHRSRSQAPLARRARVVRACAEGLDNKGVAKKLRCSLGMVGKWRGRFLSQRLEGLYDEPRPGAPREVSDEQVEKVVIQILESTPRGQTHRSTRGLAQATGLSRMTVSRIWRAFGLQPHRIDTFKLSPDPLLIEKVRDIAGLYISIRRTMPWCCVWMRRARSRRWIGRSLCCPCSRASWSAARTITSAGLPPCLPRWI